MPEQAGNPIMQFVPFIAIFFIFYFLVIAPQKKQQQAIENMRKELKKNDEVVTAGGAHGVITLIKEKTVMVRVDDNTKIEFDKEAITRVIKKASNDA